MNGISNKTKLDHVAGIEVEERPVYSASPDNFRNHLQELPRKAIWVKEPDCASRFLSVQDQTFATVHNTDVFRAMDEVAYDKGLDLEVQKATYLGGKTMAYFFLPGEEFTVPGDPSVIKPGVLAANHFGGGGKLRFLPTSLRDWCVNGQISKVDLAEAVGRVHRGTISYEEIYYMVSKSFDRLADAVETMKLIAEISAGTSVTDEQIEAFILSLENKTAKKYQDKLVDVVLDNVDQLGYNAWGVTQGISEMCEHHMTNEGTKVAWRDNAIESLLASVGVKEQVAVLTS